MLIAWLLTVLGDVVFKTTLLFTDKSNYIRTFKDGSGKIYWFDDYNLPYKKFVKLKDEFCKKYKLEVVEYDGWRTHTIDSKTLEIIPGELYREL